MESFGVLCPERLCRTPCAYVGANVVECVNPDCRHYLVRRDREVYGDHGCARCGRKSCPGTCPTLAEIDGVVV